MKKISAITFLFLFAPFVSFSQNGDSLAVKKDSVAFDTSYTKRRANRAALYSAILPGAGQFYNKKYWKIPVLYAGLTGFGLAIDFNNRQYQIFKKAYLYRVDNDSSTVDNFVNIYPNNQSLLVRKDYYRRSRDLLYVFGGVLYVLNIIDAYVDASLADFDVSDNLSLHVSPSMQFTRDMYPVASMAFCMSIR